MSDERPRYYDREGKPMTWQAWGEVFQDMDYRRICWTAISDEIHVSTVWLGLDHAFGDGPPMIFETMVFETKFTSDGMAIGPREELLSARYSTEAEARAGHERMVASLKAGPPETS